MLQPNERQRITPLVEFIMPSPALDKNRQIKESSRNKFLRKLPEMSNELLQFCGNDPIFLDVHLLDGDIRANAFDTLLSASRALDIFSIPVTHIIPVTSTIADDTTRGVAARFARESGNGLCIRIDRSHFAEPRLAEHITEFINVNDLDIANTDLLVDLKIVDQHVDPRGIVAQLARLPDLTKWRSFIVAGGAFPKDLTHLGVFETHVVDRAEWRLWRLISGAAELPRKPLFSDYTIQHPIFYGYVPGAKVSASVRYTDDDRWQVFRGQALGYINKKTGEKGPGSKQYVGHAKTIVEQPFYKGERFSFGDAEIKRIADGRDGKTGNPEKWLSIGINHHLTLVAHQASNSL
ncbi:MAG: hypothetical protein JWO97_3879 [Acidobacteria bacterium]|nr:hypothetical protein [Acidobacteriota bacterium]